MKRFVNGLIARLSFSYLSPKNMKKSINRARVVDVPLAAINFFDCDSSHSGRLSSVGTFDSLCKTAITITASVYVLKWNNLACCLFEAVCHAFT